MITIEKWPQKIYPFPVDGSRILNNAVKGEIIAIYFFSNKNQTWLNILFLKADGFSPVSVRNNLLK